MIAKSRQGEDGVTLVPYGAVAEMSSPSTVALSEASAMHDDEAAAARETAGDDDEDDEDDFIAQFVSLLTSSPPPPPPPSSPMPDAATPARNASPPPPASSPPLVDMVNDWMDNLMSSTELAVSTVAEAIREGVSDTADTLREGITQTEFYRQNVKYEPEDAPQSAQPNASEVNNDLMALSLEERFQRAGQSIGFLKVTVDKSMALSVDGTYLPDHTHPYVVVALGPFQQWTSPVAKETPQLLGSFDFNHVVNFVAQDVNVDLNVEVWEKNVLTADHLIGQVVVPLTNILPQVKNVIKGAHPRHAPYVLTGWFELFPLPAGRRKFVPASSDIAQTGMWRAGVPLGFLRLSLELHLHGRISMWAGYALPRLEPVLGASAPPMPTGDLKAISAVNESGRRFKRNFQRVKRGFSRLLSRGDAAWVPIRFLKLASSWREPRVSLLAVVFVYWGCIVAPPFMLPVNVFLVLLASTLALHGKHERERRYLIWNDDIHDPDDELGPIQKVAKVIYLLEKFERWMGIAADNLERATNLFSFADERVTIAALLGCGLAALALSLALYVVTPGYLFFVGFAFVLMPPSLKRTVKRLSSPASPRPRAVEEESTTLRKGGPLQQALAIGRLALQAPSLGMNVFRRVPTDDELGHRWIARRQQVQGEPKVSAAVIEGVNQDAELDVSLLREI